MFCAGELEKAVPTGEIEVEGTRGGICAVAEGMGAQNRTCKGPEVKSFFDMN